MKVYFGIDGTRGFPKWWFGDPYLISAAALWRKDHFRIPRWFPKGEFFLDSGGFSFFHKEGTYPFTPDQYISYINTVKPSLFATMDYPCEPNVNRSILKSNIERIEATVDYGVYLWKNRDKINSQPVVVIQGYSLREYEYCYSLYQKNGVSANYWAFGSMCRRWNDTEIRYYIRFFRRMVGKSVKIHIFGLKISSLNCEVIKLIDSIDTMAWAYGKFKREKRYTKDSFLAYRKKINSIIEKCSSPNYPLFQHKPI